MTSCWSPREATSERYSGWASMADSVVPAALRSSMVSNSGEIPTEQVGPGWAGSDGAPGSSRPTSLSRTATSRTSLTDSHMLMT